MTLNGADFSLGGKSISQAVVKNDGYALGTWRVDNTYILPDSSTTVLANLRIDGNPSTFVFSNSSGPLQGTLNRDYSGFTLSGNFGGGSRSLHLSLCGHVIARPPVADITPPGPFQCDSPGGAHVTFSSAQSYDPDNDIAHRRWEIDNIYAGTDVVTLPAILSLGSHPISVVVSDSRGATSTAAETVTVVDTTPPQLAIRASPDCIWPPNHKYILYTLGNSINAQTTDTCDPAPTIRIVKVTSNQPPLGGGSGNTVTDIQFGSQSLCVRAERDGTLMTPREYTVTLEAADHVGNKTSQQVVISVPKDQSGGTDCKINNQMVVSDDDPRCTQ